MRKAIPLMSLIFSASFAWAAPKTVLDESVEFKVKHGTVFCQDAYQGENLILSLNIPIFGKSSKDFLISNISSVNRLSDGSCTPNQVNRLDDAAATAHSVIIEFYGKFASRCVRTVQETLTVTVNVPGAPDVVLDGQQSFNIAVDPANCVP